MRVIDSFAIPANASTPETVDARVRRRLRELRRERGLTLAEVAREAALDVSTLSRLESGKRRMALDLVPALAGALGVSADELLSAPVTPEPWVPGVPQRRHGLIAVPLTRRFASEMQAYRVVIDRGRRVPPEPLPSHAGQVSIHVLDGRMRLLLGSDAFVAGPGQTVEFSTRTPHWFGVVDEAVEVIFIARGAAGTDASLDG